jgi:hypothetical protein
VYALMHVDKQPEPPHFWEKVQKDGEEFLLKNPHAKGKSLKPCWRAIIPDLYDAYSGICAYTCHWIPYDVGWPTVDHFKSKEDYPQDAYRWDNYRLVCGMMNGRKGIYRDVLDPFTLQDGWFAIHFPSLQLISGTGLSSGDMQKVEATIKRLKLNDYKCTKARQDRLKPYLLKRYTFEHLYNIAPFLAKELKRQKLDDVMHPMWEAYRQ